MLTSCVPDQTNESLTVWVADPILEQKQFRHAMFRFRQDHPDVDVHFAEGPEPVDVVTASEDEYRDYQDTLASYANQMRVEVMAHSGPDLILFTRDTFPNLYKAAASRAFAPLDPFIERDETYQCGATGSKEPFNQRVLDAGVCNGKRYFIPLTYSMPGILSTEETIRKYGGSPEELMSHGDFLDLLGRAAESGDGANLMAWSPGWSERYYAPLDCLFYTQWDGLWEMDYNRQTFSLHRENLKARMGQYRALSQYQPDPHKGGAGSPLWASLASGSQVAGIFGSMDLAMIGGGYVYYQKDPYISPLLNADGEIAVWLETGAAINAYSPNQQNAYEFLKYAMQAQGYLPDNNGTDMYVGLPVNEAALEARIARNTNPNMTHPPEFRPLPQETFDQFREWNRNIGEVYIDTGLDEQIQEWFQPYFRGEQSFDSCYQTMENALEIMISE